MSDFDRLLNALQQTGYHQWMKSEGIPVAVGHGLEDVRDIKLAPWRRTGGLVFRPSARHGRHYRHVRGRDSAGRGLASGKASL